MLKMRGRDSSGHPIIIIGLSRQNLDRLRWGEPISFSLTELAFDGGSVVIFSGATEADMTREFLDLAAKAGIAVEMSPPKKRRL